MRSGAGAAGNTKNAIPKKHPKKTPSQNDDVFYLFLLFPCRPKKKPRPKKISGKDSGDRSTKPEAKAVTVKTTAITPKINMNSGTCSPAKNYLIKILEFRVLALVFGDKLQHHGIAGLRFRNTPLD